MTKKAEKGRIIVGDNMSTKDNLQKYRNLIILLVVSILILTAVMIYKTYISADEVFATKANIKETSASIDTKEISNANKIDIDEIIAKNINNEQEEYITEEVELEYITKYTNNPELPKGMVQVVQEGRTGKQEITTKKLYENGELVGEEQISSKVTKASVNKIVEIGAASYTSSYKVKVGDIVYATSDRIGVMTEPSEEAEKVATLQKDTELKVLAIQDSWYQISSSSARGYVKSESTTYINKNIEESTSRRKH